MPELSTLATLGLVVDNTQVDRAKASLDAFNASAAGAEARTMALAGQVSGLESAYASAVGGAVVPITHELEKIPKAAIHGEQGLGRLERSMAGLGITASGLTGEGGHVAHLVAVLASLGLGGETALLVIGGFTAMALAMHVMGEDAATSTKELQKLDEAYQALIKTHAGAARSLAERATSRTTEIEEEILAHAQRINQLATPQESNYGVRDAIDLAAINDELEKINKLTDERLLRERELHAFTTDARKADQELSKKHLDQLQQETDFVVRLNEEIEKGTKAAYDAALKGTSVDVNEKWFDEFNKQLNEVYEGTKRLLDVNPEWRASMEALVPVMNQLFGTAEGNRQEAVANLARMHDEIAKIGLEINESLKGWDRMSASEKKLVHDLQSDFSKFFDDLLTNGISSFATLFDEVRKMFIKLVADIAAQKLTAQLTGGADAAGTGAAGGAAALNPATLAITGGLLVLGGIVSWMQNATAQAAALAKATKDFATALDSYDSALKAGSLDDKIRQERDRSQALRDQALALEHQTADTVAYYAAIDRINAAESRHVHDLIEEADLLAARATEDYNLRTLRAEGFTAEADAQAFALAQQREWADAVKASGLSADAFAATAQGAALQTALWADGWKRVIDLQATAIQQRITGTQQEIAATQQQLALTTQTVATLQAYMNQLKGLTGSPITNISDAKQAFDDLAKKALGGDQTAAGQLPAVAQQFLNLSKQYNASGAGYTSDVQYVQNALQPILDFYKTQQTDQQKMLDLLNRQLVTEQQQLATLQGGFTNLGDVFTKLNVSIQRPVPNYGPSSGVVGSISPAPGPTATQADATNARLDAVIALLQTLGLVNKDGLATVATKVDTGAAKTALAVEGLRLAK